jgi:hypothetical protein
LEIRDKPTSLLRSLFVSIVRIGLAETKNFGEGYEAIFGRKNTSKKPVTKRKIGSAKVKSKRSKSK